MTGSLETFSLPELFRLIDSGGKTGQLIIQPPLNQQSLDLNPNYEPPTYHLWFHKGRLITTVSYGLRHECLVSLIKNRGWLSNRVIEKLAEVCPAEVPLGNYLSKMKVLETEKLKLLFQLQLHQVYQLFNLNSGQFRLEVFSPEKLSSASMPWLDMTGVSMQASQVNLLALRIMRNWSSFAHKLPEKNSALQQLIRQPKFRLTTIEQAVWQMAQSNMSLEQLAQFRTISLLEVRKAAFCLMMARLVEEIPLANFQSRPSSIPTRKIKSLPVPETGINRLAIAEGMAKPIAESSLRKIAVQNPPKNSNITAISSTINSTATSIPAQAEILQPKKPKVSQALLSKLVNFLRSKL
jgi:hypothetical protein